MSTTDLHTDTTSAVAFLCDVASLSGYTRDDEPESRLITLVAIEPDLPKGHAEKIIAATFQTDSAGDRRRMADFVEQRNAARNLYFGPSALRRPMNKKPCDLDVSSSRFVWADLDPRAGEDLSEERDRILGVIGENRPSAVPEPSIVIDSGNGYQALWILDEPIEVGGLQDAVDDFKLYGQALAIELGGDMVQDPSRILRVPGTVNHPDATKRKKGRARSIASLVRFDADKAHPLATIPKARSSGEIRVRKIRDLGDLKLPDDLRDSIQTGSAPIDKPSRSEHVFWVASRMLRAGVAEDVIVGVLTDPSFGISESVLDKPEGQQVRQARRAVENARARNGDRPWIRLPGAERQHRDFCVDLGSACAARGVVRRGGSAFTLEDRDLSIIRADRGVTVLERAGSFYVQTTSGDGKTTQHPKPITEPVARVVLAADEFAAELPEVRVVSDCPVLYDSGGHLVSVTGFDEDLGILTRSDAIPEPMSIDDAAAALDDLLGDYDFATESDRARAFAAILSPAMNTGRFLGSSARVPMLVVEADDSQAGKGLFCRLIASIYGTTAGVVTQREKGSVGSAEELIQGHLLRGRSMVLIDNVRGRFGSPLLESALTERSISCRVPYRGDVAIDPSGVSFMLTSNEAELTIDLANRSNFVRIRKRPDDYRYRSWPEGSIEDHLTANQSRYLGAVWAVLRGWHAAGKPMSDDQDRGHDFSVWGRAVRAIVRDMLGLADPLDGVRLIQREKATPSSAWVRRVLHAVIAEGWEGTWWRASELIDVCEARGVDVPGVQASDDLGCEETRGKASQGIGRRLSAVFRKAEGGVVEIDGLRFERRELPREEGRGVSKWYSVGEPAGQPGDLDIVTTGEEPF